MKQRRLLLGLILLGGAILTACGDSPSAALSLPTAGGEQVTAPASLSTPVEETVSAVAPALPALPTPANRPPTRVAVGYTAPDFTLPSLQKEQISLNQFLGKPVLINFWATWCGPCKEELPLLQRTYVANQERLVVLGVDVAEEVPLVRLKVREVGMTYPNVLDATRKITTQYRVSGYPSSFLLDKDGVIRAIYPGAFKEDTLRTFLEKVLT